MPDSSPILEFDSVAIEPSADYDTGLTDVSFTLAPGTLIHIGVGDHESRHPLFDAAQGMIAPTRGSIRFESDDWGQANPTDAADRRARMGRVFREGGWLNNLDVDENITLKLRHHTRLDEGDIRDEAEAIASRVGLSGLPAERPAWVGRSTLKRAQWVRALIGAPRLILLDHPTRDVDRTHMHAFYDLLNEAMAGQASILWVSPDSQGIRDAQLHPTAEYRIVAGEWTQP